MSVRVLESAEALAVAAAEFFAEQAQKAIQASGCFKVVLSGGSTPKRMFELLASDQFKSRINWNNVAFFWGDERWVPATHPDSNYRLASQTLLSKVPASHIYRMRTELATPEETALDYERQLRSFFGLADPLEAPRFDLVFLGLGEDGHTASLFPDSDLSIEEQRWVISPWVNHLKTHRISLSVKAINHAKAVVFLVSGVNKATILKAVLSPEFQAGPYPAQRIHPISGELRWLIDQEASGAQKAA